MIPLQKGGSDDLRKYTWFFGIMVTYLYRNESNGTVFAIVCRRLIISQGLYVFELALSNEELRFSLVNRSKWFWVVWLNDAQSRLRFEMGRAVDWGVSCVLWLWVVSGWVGGTVCDYGRCVMCDVGEWGITQIQVDEMDILTLKDNHFGRYLQFGLRVAGRYLVW